MQQFYVCIRTTFYLLLVDCHEAPSVCVNCNKQTVVIESARPTISWQQRNKFYVLSERNLATPRSQCFACQKSRCTCLPVLMSSVVPRPIRVRKLLSSNFKTEKDLSAVAVETGKVANIVSSLRMF
jgi:hypothetical protein